MNWPHYHMLLSRLLFTHSFFFTLLHLPPGEQLLPPPPPPPLPDQQCTQGVTLDALERISRCLECNVQHVMAGLSALTRTYGLMATFLKRKKMEVTLKVHYAAFLRACE